MTFSIAKTTRVFLISKPLLALTVCAWLIFFSPAKTHAQSAPTLSAAPGPCTANTNGAVLPIWTGTQVSCITEPQFSSQPAGSWNVCLSGVGEYQNGVWSCSPSASSAAYSTIYLLCLAYGLGATIGCSSNTWAQDLLLGFVPTASWLSIAADIGDILVNNKPGAQTICDAASLATSLGSSLPITVAGAAIDAFCQSVPGTTPASYTVTSTATNGAVTTLAVQVTASSSGGPTISSVIGLQSSNGVISAAAGSQLLQFEGSSFLPGLTVIETPPSGGNAITLTAPQVQNVSATSFILAVNFGGNPGVYTFQVINPDGTRSNISSLTVGPPSPPAGPALVQALVQPQSTSIQLSPGAGCVYGMVTGGGASSSAFATGQSTSVTDADGLVSAQLAYGANSTDSFSTNAGYFTIGGACIAGPFDQFVALSATNSTAAASGASLNFTTTEPALVLVIALASSQKIITLSGLQGLNIDATSAGHNGWEPMVVGHVQLPPGTYSVVETSSIADLQGQDPNHMADLIGVFIFGQKQ